MGREVYGAGIRSTEELDSSTAAWHKAASAEWGSLTGQPQPFHMARFRSVPAPGPRASAAPDSPRLAAQWRQLASRFEEVGRVVRRHGLPWREGQAPWSPSVALLVSRHAVKAKRLADGMAKESAEEAARVGYWLLCMDLATALGDAIAVSTLVAVARRTAAKLVVQAAGRAATAWRQWLHGDVPAGALRGQQPTKRAFLFVRGAAGWSRSPTGQAEDFDEDIPAEGDDIDAHTDEPPTSARLWSATCSRTPLSDQAAVELEANKWASQWSEGG